MFLTKYCARIADDSDNDSIIDGQEVTEGTNPLDRGSVLPKRDKTLCTEWNGFLGMVSMPLGDNFDSALQLEGVVGNGQLLTVPLDTENSSSVLKLANTLNEEIKVEVNIYAFD